MSDPLLFQNGATWLRADFHLHTRKDKEFSYEGEENRFVTGYVAALKASGIQVGVITNHNKFDLGEFNALRKAARKEEIFLLPGVELSVGDGSNGVHCLIVFNDAWLGGDHINAFLTATFNGKLPQEYENENGRTEINLLAVLKQLEDLHKDFFVVCAHVEQKSGLWKEFDGGRLEELGKSEIFRRRCLAFQKVRTNDERVKVQGWLGNAYPAEVEGCDCKSLKSLEGAKDASKKTYLKLGAFSFEALKYALRDCGQRVSAEPAKVEHSHIESVSFEGGILAGQTIHLSPELNTLIGIRGSGKSSLLEALRYVLDIPFGERATDRSYKESLLAHALGSAGQVSLSAVDQHGQRYEVRRLFKERAEVFVDGKLRSGISIRETVLRKPIYFGQKDLSSSGEGFEKDLIEKLVGSRLEKNRQEIQAKREEVTAAIAAFFRTSKAEEQIEEYEEKRLNAQHQLEIYARHGVDEKLEKRVAFDADAVRLEQAILAFSQYLSSSESVINDHEDNLRKQSSYKSKHNAEFFEKFFNCYREATDTLTEHQASAKTGRAILKRLESWRAQFAAGREDLKEEFAQLERQLIEELQGEGVSLRLDEFKKVQEELSLAKRMLETLSTSGEKRKNADIQLKSLLSELNELWLKEFRAIESELERINKDDSALQIVAEFKGDRRAALEYMKSLFKGSKFREAKLEALLKDYQDFGGMYADLKAAMDSVGPSSATFEEYFSKNLVELLTWQVPNRFTIEYHNKELKQHSLGQRASALILFILAQQDNDVILIDQPEDDLDNQTIYQDVIKLLCKIKPRVQFIFATHNPNFPVLGDAEQIVTCRYEDEKVQVSTGGVDSAEQQENIVSIMEGGYEALSRRKQRYESWTHQNS